MLCIVVYGKERLCDYDGFYYCDDCHTNKIHFIPARIIYNWDFRPYLGKLALPFCVDVPLNTNKSFKSLLISTTKSLIQCLTNKFLEFCNSDFMPYLRKLVVPCDW